VGGCVRAQAIADLIGNLAADHWEHTPPSTGIVYPVTYRASSDSRKTTGSAISSGWPILNRRRVHDRPAAGLQHLRDLYFMQ
jgi:hypothetical protein